MTAAVELCHAARIGQWWTGSKGSCMNFDAIIISPVLSPSKPASQASALTPS